LINICCIFLASKFLSIYFTHKIKQLFFLYKELFENLFNQISFLLNKKI
jgi:hypothetical protein